METPLLDSLYVPGTSQAYRELVDASAVFPKSQTAVSESPTAGGVSTEVLWETAAGEIVGFFRVLYYGAEANAVGLWIEPRFTGKGVLTLLCERLNDWWGSIGVRRVVMQPGSPTSQTILETAGFGKLDGGAWGANIPSPSISRFVAAVRAGHLPQPGIF